jgi:hypothetical protein
VPEERRKLEEKIQKLLKELTVAQQCSLSEISSFGYTLSFVRSTTDGKIAVVQLDNGAITINDEGEIDHHPNIKIRH